MRAGEMPLMLGFRERTEMERNLLEREISALRANSFGNLVSMEAEVKMFPANFPGKTTEPSFLREKDLKTKQTVDKKQLYFLPNQWIDVLGEDGDWFLAEGDAFYMERGKEKKFSTKLQGFIKKAWVIHKTPAKLDEEPKASKPPSEYTCYVEIDAGITDKGYRGFYFDKDAKKWKTATYSAAAPPDKMTAVYVPQNFKPDAEADLIIYLYGFVDGHPKMKDAGGKKIIPSIKDYLDYSLTTDFTKAFAAARGKPLNSYLDFRAILRNSGKNVVFVAPTLGAKAQSGKLAGGFDNYVDQVIWAINEYVFKGRGLAGKLELRNLIIAAHSGGGSAMLKIAQQTKSVYVKRIKEYWGFDAWYDSSASWNVIARDKSINIYAYPFDSWNIPTEDKKTVFVTAAGKDANLTKLMGTGESRHFTLLPYYFEERLSKL